MNEWPLVKLCFTMNWAARKKYLKVS